MSYKPVTIQRNRFDGGISDSSRKSAINEFQTSRHFDIFTDPFKLIPYRSLESDTSTTVSDTDLKQYSVRNFIYASNSAKLYGLGKTAGGLTKIVYKDDATTGNWTLPSSSEGTDATIYDCFFEYKDYAWGFQGTTSLFKWGTLSGTPSITNAAATVSATITSVANGIIAADGNAYCAYNNVIVRIAPAGTITDNAKTVPDTYKITSLTNYGSFMAIAAAPKSTYNGKSKVFIWNLSSDLFSETIDWGEGELRVLEYIEGLLIGITDRYLNNSTGAGKGSMIVQAYTGGSAQVLKEIYTQALTGKTIPLSKEVKNNRLFWAAKIMTNTAGTTYNEGIWSFGRKNSQYPFALSLDIIDENINTSGIQGFGTAANFFFIAHSSDGSLDKTNDSSTYSFTSEYESQIENFGDSCLYKKLEKFTIYTTPLPASSVVTVKYKMDAETSYTTLGSFSTTGGISRDFINIESTGDNFPTFKEITFILQSTDGAEITGYKATALPLIISS